MHNRTIFAKLEQKMKTQKIAAQEDEKGSESATIPTLSQYDVSVPIYKNKKHKRIWRKIITNRLIYFINAYLRELQLCKQSDYDWQNIY